MKFLKCAFWTTAAAVLLAGSASAQGVGGLGGTGGGGLGGGGGGGGLGNLISSLGGGGGGLGGGGAGGAGTAPGGTNSGITSVNITAPSVYAQPPQNIATSNIVGRYYANPFWQGRAGTSTGAATSPQVVNPGGFGQATFGTNFGAATTGTAAGGRAGTVGGGGFGGTTLGGARGAMSGAGAAGATGSGQVVSPGAPGISYTATVKFDVKPVSAGQFQSDVQGVLTRTSGLSNPAGVQLTTGPNGAVLLRGQVRDADEARLIEGLLRTTPGVRNVTNELQFPKE